MKQIAIQVRNSSNVAVTGLTISSFSIRVSPYGTGDAISGLSCTEIGSQGNYVISGATDWYENIKVFADTGSGMAEQTWIGVQDFGDMTLGFVTDNGTQTIGGAKTFSSVVVCSTPATSSTHLIRYGEALRTTGNQASTTGIKTFVDSIGYTTATAVISNEWQFPHRKYVDDLFAGSTGVVQSTYTVKLLPTRTTEDRFSQTTPEKCNTYLSGLSNIATYRGTMLIEGLGQASNAINLDDGTSQWITDGVDIVGLNRPTLTRRGYNSSLTFLTSYGSLNGVKLVDSSAVASRTYINFVFNDCWFYVNATEMAFTTCKFYNCVFQFAGGETVTFSNCTGSGLTYNDDASVTFTGTQPANVISTNTANIGF